MAHSRHTKQSRTPQKKQNASTSRKGTGPLVSKESPAQDRRSRYEPGYDSLPSKRRDYFNEAIESQGIAYDFPDRSEEPFPRESGEYSYNQEFDRYSQGSFFHNRFSPQEVMGPHSGKGPKGFSRTDTRIEEEVCEMLTHHPSIDARDIEVEVKNGEVILSGTVPERRMKYYAEDGAANLFGVVDVVNNLRIKKTEETSAPSTH